MAEAEDVEYFMYESFNADKYTKEKFLANTEKDVRTIFADLQSSKEEVAKKLKREVFENYPRFISTSKEISSMVGDMLQLGNALHDLKSIMKGLQEDSYDLKDDDGRGSSDSPSKPSSSSQPSSSSVSGGVSQSSNQANSSSSSSSADAMLDNSGSLLLSLIKTQDLTEEEQWLVECPDDLDVAIAERDFQKALDLSLQAKSMLEHVNQTYIPGVAQQIEDRVTRLASTLIHSLQGTAIRKSDRKKMISYLIKLEREEEARDIFLRSRSDWIRSEIRKLKFQGDISLYTDEISHLVFSTIRTACAEFRTIFKNSHVMSEFFLWATSEVEYFAHLLRRQVFLSDSFRITAECLQIAMSHCKSLEKQGLTLLDRLISLFKEDISQAISQYCGQLEVSLSKVMQIESWTGKEYTFLQAKQSSLFGEEQQQEGPEEEEQQQPSYRKGKSSSSSSSRSSAKSPKPLPVIEHDSTVLRLTDSGRHLYAIVHRLVTDVGRIAHLEYYPALVNGLVTMLEDYFVKVNAAATSSQLNDKQIFSLIANALFVADDLLEGRARKEMQRLFKHPIPELHRLHQRLAGLDDHLCELYAKQRAQPIVSEKLGWGSPSYPQVVSMDAAYASPSKTFQMLFVFLSKLTPTIVSCLGDDFVPLVIEQLLEKIALEFVDSELWDRITPSEEKPQGHRPLTDADANQVILDLRFFIEVGGSFLSSTAENAIHDSIERICEINSETNHTSKERFMASEDFFEDVVARIRGTEPVKSAIFVLDSAYRKAKKRTRQSASGRDNDIYDD